MKVNVKHCSASTDGKWRPTEMCHVAFGANCLVTGKVKSLPHSVFRHSHRVAMAVIGAFKILQPLTIHYCPQLSFTIFQRVVTNSQLSHQNRLCKSKRFKAGSDRSSQVTSVSFEERLRELSLFCLEESRFQGDLNLDFQYIKGAYKKQDGTGLWAVWSGWRCCWLLEGHWAISLLMDPSNPN